MVTGTESPISFVLFADRQQTCQHDGQDFLSQPRTYTCHVGGVYEGIFTPGARCMLLYHVCLTSGALKFAPNGYSVQLTSVGSLLCGNAMPLKCPKSWCLVSSCHPCRMKRVKELDLRLIQWINLFFCFKLGWTHMQARAALQQVFPNDLLHPSRTRRWYQAFRNGWTTLVDLQRHPKRRSGRSPANVQAVQALINNDKSISLHSIMLQTGLKLTTVHRIVRKDLQLTLRSARLLPNFLTPRHILQRFQHSRDMLTCANRNPSILKKLVTMDEAWCYQYDPFTKRQASQWLSKGEDRPTHPRRPMSVKKVMLVAFFDYLGMIHFEFLRGGTVDTPTFIQILGCFRDSLRIRRPRRIRYLHMDNAPAHGSRDTRLHLLMTGQKVIDHPPPCCLICHLVTSGCLVSSSLP